MPAIPKWAKELFENALDGVSSAVTPELIQPTQLAWGKNVVNRGAKPGTRPSFRRLLTLPSGLVQGVSYFGVQGGMGVTSINGHIYRIRIGVSDATFEEIELPWWNSAIVKQVYMQQTVETLVIQDGQSNAILYDGSTAERSDPANGGVPLGRQMAYGNGRLWVAINGKELVAGDIRSNVIGSELSFTETNYLSGGGTFFFPRGITGLNFIATTGTTDYGALIIFGSDYCDSLRADVTFRDLWAQMPGFITSVLRHTGCASHWSLGQINQDLFWRDAGGGIRSIRSSLADESGAGNAPISREVSRLTDYDSPQLLQFCSAISFNNRLLVTSSPRLNEMGGVTWRSLISLDFAPVSTMRGKSFPAYDGQWEGINFTHLFQGQFNGRSRAFAISLDDAGSNSLWEIMPDGRGPIADETIGGCTDGTGLVDLSPIVSTIEYGRRSFGNPSLRKRIERCDVYLWALRGELDLKVYWRSDNNQKWRQWDEVEVCATNGDPEDPNETVHVWKNLLPQQRPQIKTFTIPSDIDEITRYSFITGFEFQIRLVWTGRVTIYKTVLHSTYLDDTPYALRDVLDSACLDNDVTGNEIIYTVPVSPCPFIEITMNPEDVVVDLFDDPFFLEIIYERFDGPFVYPVGAPGTYHRTSIADGSNRWRFSQYGNTPWNTPCCVTYGECEPIVNIGLGAIGHVLSGQTEIDPQTGIITGELMDIITARGVAPGPMYYTMPSQVTVVAENPEDLLQKIYLSHSAFGGRYYDDSTNWGTWTRKQRWFTPSVNVGPEGYFGGYGGSIWCLGYDASMSSVGIITMDEIGQVATVFGDPAKIQHLTQTGTNVYNDTTSRVRIRFRNRCYSSFAYVSYPYEVVPDNGDQPYRIAIYEKIPATYGQIISAIREHPKVLNATVTISNAGIRVECTPSIDDEFERFPDWMDMISVQGLDPWPEAMNFTMTSPNSETWDNFSGETEGFLYILSNGLGWADNGSFTSVNLDEAYDDMTGYALGPNSALYLGAGWAGIGFCIIFDNERAQDEFEDLTDGETIEFLSLPIFDATQPNQWAQIGLDGLDGYSGYFTTLV